VIISLHIPKCAGTSFRHTLEEAYGAGLWLNYGDDFSFDAVPPCTECIHGHIPGDAYNEIFPGHQTITMVRNPVQRVVSNYYHFLHNPDPRHPASIKLHAEQLTLREFAEIACMRNKATRYVAGRNPEDFDFVGITEEFEESVLLFAKLFQINKSLPVFQDNVNPDRSTPIYDISRSDHAHILDLNAADVDWYFRACKLFAQSFRAHFCTDPISRALGEMVSLLDEEKGQVVYSMETFVGIWKITQNPNVLWIRGREASVGWKEIGVFPTPEEATFAVGTGRTRVPDWDICPHRPEDFALPRWNQMSA
jgi:Sulfotransferase family